MLAALVPIKKKSERLPNKNFRLFNGRPLWMHILSTLDGIDVIDEILVNTDSEELLGSSLTKKTRFIKRPEHLRGNHINGDDLARYDITQTKADTFLQTFCTNPLLTAGTIKKAISQFRLDSDHDTLFGVTRLQARFYCDGSPVNHSPYGLERTQDLQPVFEDNSCIYLFTRESFRNSECRLGETPFMFEIPKIEAIDIDDIDDFRMAESVALRG